MNRCGGWVGWVGGGMSGMGAVLFVGVGGKAIDWGVLVPSSAPSPANSHHPTTTLTTPRQSHCPPHLFPVSIHETLSRGIHPELPEFGRRAVAPSESTIKRIIPEFLNEPINAISKSIGLEFI